MTTSNHHVSDLASWLHGKARTLSYNDENGPLKHKLHEASHALDTSCVSVIRKGTRLFVRNARGKQRRMTIRERIAYIVLGKRTDIRP